VHTGVQRAIDELMLISYEKAAERLGMTPGALRALVSRGGIPHVRIADRTVRFDEDDLGRWLTERRVPARAAIAAACDTDGGRAR
jgi:excisionase family DNA binding protein